ncbi:TIGR03364 family FAD-dependent oxidoreductase [Acinetobacter sp. WZC-1]|uniref:TIGR03364 family FAD-dependent oxidoreductase n=1 Tax=Acinetobacter sp. WZC-1 TaxID=3459034 RepID=UPI00403E2091
MNTAQFDLIIVGAGILGLSAAIQAKQQGLNVCIFEKDAEAVGATRRNFGMVGTSTLTRPDAKWRDYAIQTLEFYQQIQAQTDISFQQRQGVYFANTALEYQVLTEFAGMADQYQIPVQLLDAAQLRTRFEYLNPETELQGGLIFEEDYSVEPQLVGKLLLAYAQAQGVEIHTNACVVRTSAGHGLCQVSLASGAVFQSAKVLICHGDAVDILYPELLQRLGLKRCGLQMALTRPLPYQLNASIYSGLSIARYPAFEICPGYPALLQQSQQGLVKDYGIHILIKQNASGELIIGDSHEYFPIQDAPQFQQREQINQFIEDYCRNRVGLALPDIQNRWNGYYLTHDSELACVTEAEQNIFLVSAIAGKGMTTGPGFMAEVLTQNIF